LNRRLEVSRERANGRLRVVVGGGEGERPLENPAARELVLTVVTPTAQSNLETPIGGPLRLAWLVRPFTTEVGMRTSMIVGVVMAFAVAAPAAQDPPPVNPPVALEGTMTKFYKGLNTLVVTTVDGMQHVYHLTKGLVVHGGAGSGVDALESVHEGATVVVHYRIEAAEQSIDELDRVADEGLKVLEGTVIKLDRRRQEITLKYGNGKTETLRLTDRAATEVSEGLNRDGVPVVIYYADESGRKVAHFVKKAS